MNPWLESGLTAAGLGTGLVGGWWVGRTQKRLGIQLVWWVYGLIFMVMAVRAVLARIPQYAASPGFGWADWGRSQYPINALLGTLWLSSIAPLLTLRRTQILVGVLAAVVGFQVGVWPVVSFLTQRTRLAGLPAQFFPGNVCRQSTDFTCGPAAAVTALGQLGLTTTEGELATWCRTSPGAGTPGDILAQTLTERFGAAGLQATWQRVPGLAALQAAGPALVVVKYYLGIDHWLYVREVTDSEVVFADPLVGWDRESHAQFLKRWRKMAVTLGRQ